MMKNYTNSEKNAKRTKKMFLGKHALSLINLGMLFLLFAPNVWSQSPVSRIYTDWNGYWTSDAPTPEGNRPNTINNLIAFEWNGTTYSTAVNDAVLISKDVFFDAQKFRALKIQSLDYKPNGGTFFLQGSMIDGSATERVLTPPLTQGTSTPAELASRLTDGKNGLGLGTGIANIETNSVYFRVGTNNLNLDGLNDGIPDLVVTQVAATGGANDVFKFIDAAGNQVGNEISVAFGEVPVVGNYNLDIFNASNGSIANYPAADNRPIRILVYDTSAFGITEENAPQVDRFVVTFSGDSDCAFIAFNANSLRYADLSMVKKATIEGCGGVGNKINYTFDITNTGDVPVTDVVLEDPLEGLVITGTQGTTLASGETISFTGVYTITAEDVAAGRVINSATVKALDPSLNIVEDISGLTITDGISTVTNLLTAPTGITGNAALCGEGNATILSVSGGNVGTGATVEWFTGSCDGPSAGTGNSITVTPTANTTYYVRYKSTCNDDVTTCASQLVKVSPIPSTPTVGTITQPTTEVATGSVELSDLPVSGTIKQTGTSTKNYTITGSSMTISELAPGNYTFSISNGDCSSPSAVSVTIEKSLGTNDFATKSNKVVVFVKNKQISINSNVEKIKKVLLYDITGKMIYQKDNVNSNELLLDFRMSHQVLIVKTTLQNGNTFTNKVIN